MEKKTDVILSMQKLEPLFDEVSQIEVKIEAKLTEFMSGETVSGFSHTRIITPNILIKFLSKSPAIFTPGTALNGYVSTRKIFFYFTKINCRRKNVENLSHAKLKIS